jgi:fengycin family lipopeptide synthetase D
MGTVFTRVLEGRKETFSNDDACIHHLIQQQVERTPEHVAVFFEDKSLTYRELNDRANQVAHLLLNKGLNREEPVIVSLERSLEMVIALLGILKAGGAYVPVDPTFPVARIQGLVNELGQPLVLTTKKNESLFKEGDVIFLDTHSWDEKVTTNPEVEMDADSLMYIIYTSGSTGKPKGVMNTHRALNNRLQWMQREFLLNDNDRILQKTPYSFDVSVWEFFWPLMEGASIVMAIPDGHKDPEYLYQTIQEYKVTTLHFVPSMLQLFLDGVPDLSNTSIKRVICSGEALKKSTESQFFDQSMDVALYNLYGPTEAAIDVSYWRCTTDDRSTSVPIGYPISNIDLYLLDEKMRPVAEGENGELYIGGVGLATGYYGQPSLTSERFIPNPFKTGEKLYKTGDLCRLRRDGAIEYLGRNDFQVKINGLRIELGEIEHALEALELIKQSVVMAVTEDTRQFLTAYLVIEEKQDFVEEEVRAQLMSVLPAYMVPSLFVCLEKLPLSINGKVDRAALPRPIIDENEIESETLTETETFIASIWKDDLGVSSSLHQSFLYIGGNSLFAARVASRLRKKYGVPITIQTVFEHPTISSLAYYVDNKSGAIEEPSSVIEGDNTLSDAQKRLWFLNELEGASSLYNLPSYVDIEGDLILQDFKRSLDLVIQNQRALQSHFVTKNGEPLCVVDKERTSDLVMLDYSMFSYNQAIKMTENHMREDAVKLFHLSIGPLYRFTLFKVSEYQHRFYFNFHHIIFDGWSESIFLNNLLSAYDGEPVKVSGSYSDYIKSQERFSSTTEAKEEINFWKRKLSKDTPSFELFKTQKHRESTGSPGDEVSFQLSKKELQGLESLCQNSGTTLYAGLLSLYKLLIYKLSSEKDISIGTPVAGRSFEGTDDIIGMFVNTIVLRNQIEGTMTFKDFLQSVKHTTLEALSNDKVPFEKVVEAIQPNRASNQNPLFQYMFAFQNYPDAETTTDTLKLGRPVLLNNQTSKFDLTLFLEPSDEGFKGKFEYRSDVFQKKDIDRLTSLFKQMFHFIESENPIDEWSLVTDEEREKTIYGFNKTQMTFPDVHLHELFEEQVKRTPDYVAAEYEGETITYGELERRSNQLAHLLIQKGINPDTPVGLVMGRSIELVIAMMGILKAGGAYLPLDIEAPESRIKDILIDANAPICITNQALTLGEEEKINVLIFEEILSEMDNLPTEKPTVDLSPLNLVSVYYTSGSTGKPKGVSSTHRGWVNRVCWMQNKHHLKEGETALQKTTLTFDDAAIEFFWPLMVGGRVALIPPGAHKDPREILRYAVQYNVSLLQFVPSMLQMVIDEITPEMKEKLQNLRVVVSSGEALKSELMNQFYEKMPGHLYNTWGATEVSIDSTCFDCISDHTGGSYIVSVGRPIDNNRVYALDRYLQPVLIGVPGDLYIAGIGLARGYLNNPEKTKASFMEDPFYPGEHMYRTGDRGYLTEDGNIMFLGREDNQVKIRGMRVELGEIENRIREIDGIKDAVVLFQKGDVVSHLIAYFSSDEFDLDGLTIKNKLSKELPEYMVPSFYMELQQFPLNANGKVDRNHLPNISESNLVVSTEFTVPSNDTEREILSIWVDKLGIDHIGTNDNFFELGGHSLLAVKIMASINKAFSLALPVKVLFDHPTIKRLGEVMNGYEKTDQLTIMERTVKTEMVPLTDAQRSIWFLDQLNQDSKYNMPLVLRFDGLMDPEKLRHAINALIARHESLRTRFINKDGEPLQMVMDRGEIELNRRKVEETSIQSIVQQELQTRFELTQGPLVRAALVEMVDEMYLILTFHHIICDGWSLMVIKDELIKLCNGEELSPYLVQYPDYALAYNELVERSENSQKQLQYWKEKLSGFLPFLQLPQDLDEERNGNNTIKQHVPKSFSKMIKQFSKDQKYTPFIVFMGAFYALLARLSREEDIIVGTPIVNRPLEELERSVGLFLNTLPLRTMVKSEGTVQEHLDNVRDTVFHAFHNQDVPFERIVETVQPERNLNRNPLFDVMINYRSFEEKTDFRVGDMNVQEVDVDEIQSKFFMTLYIEETESEYVLDLSYQNSSFSSKRMEAFIEQYLHLLRTFIQQPQSLLKECSLVTPALESLLPDLGSQLVSKEYPRITDLVRRIGEETPEQTAVEEGGNRYSYKQLNHEVDRVASGLLSTTSTGDVVAVYGKRSYRMIVSILGVLECDAVFLNVDENVPSVRLKEMLSQSNVKRILLTEELNPDHVSVLDELSLPLSRFDELSGNEVERAIRPKENRGAYLFFTSGTTGKPKGILGTHNGLSHFLEWQCSNFKIKQSDRFAQLTNVTFDVYLRDVFLPLTSGATLCIPSEHEDVLSFIEEQKITAIHAVPSLSKLWIKSYEGNQLSDLRYVFFAGESLSKEVITLWQAKSRAEMISLYGQTETTLAKSFYEVSGTETYEHMPIGRPLPDTQIFILNDSRKLTGVGEAGELIVRTPYKTLGYLDDQETFVKNPFTDCEEDTIYRTGDIGRYLPTGEIEILGRQDEQIKVRGVRFNKREVTEAVKRIEGIKECYILDVKEKDEVTLYGYVVTDAITSEEIREQLYHVLPLSLVPNAFIIVPYLPVTVNGKIDKAKLLSYKSEEEVVKKEPLPQEPKIHKIWEELLKLPRMSHTDNFFTLGGHSLLIVKMIGMIKDQFGIELSLKEIFKNPTIHSIAELLSKKKIKPKSEIKRVKRVKQTIKN